jgi:putative ABC transport system permease protein
MKITDSATLAFKALQHRNLRSWLAILGIIIGVAAVVMFISISIGLSQQINNRLNTLGGNIIIITPGNSRATNFGGGGEAVFVGGGGGFPGGFPGQKNSNAPLTFSEANSLQSLDGVDYVDARLSERGQIIFENKNASASIVGSNPQAFLATVGVNMLKGNPISSGNPYGAVIGYSVANTTFNDSNMINRQININNVTFKVIGILNQSGTSFGGADSEIFIPLNTAKNLFNQTENASEIVIAANPNYDTTTVSTEVQNQLLLLQNAKNGQQNFQVETAASVQSTISSITNALSLFLGGIASISLIVGGIGVANTMFMSVLEQTKYIGILKALGMRSNDVLLLFLFEAGIIGLIGGVIGIGLSLIISFLLTSIGIPSVITIELVALGLGFSFFIGLISGFIPARSAASLQPITALNYE